MYKYQKIGVNITPVDYRLSFSMTFHTNGPIYIRFKQNTTQNVPMLKLNKKSLNEQQCMQIFWSCIK